MTWPPAVIARLICPTCGASVLSEGGLICRNGHPLTVTDGYVDASGSIRDQSRARTAEAFGYEWETFSDVRPEDRKIWERFFSEVPLEKLRHGIALDAGCGNGRFAKFTAPFMEALVALDGSRAARSAASNLRSSANVVVVRADLRDAPFAQESFDFIYSIGVLHHLTDPREGFRAVTKLLAPGGHILIFVYSRAAGPGARAFALRSVRAVRRLSLRVPSSILRAVTWPMAVGAWTLIVLPGKLGERAHLRLLARLPLAGYRDLSFRTVWLNTFDLLTSPLEHRYLWPGIEPWFSEVGLEVDSVRDENGLIILAHRPPGGARPIGVSSDKPRSEPT